MIQIGDKSFNTRRPADLEAQVLAATGCGALEVQRQMQGFPLAQHVARALRPFLAADGPDLATLTAMVVEGGTAEVAAQVATLYATVPAVADAIVTDGQG